MYCPSCGSNNQADVKFCTRCGTNLAVVSEALTGRLPAKTSADDDHTAKLMRDYYRGRKDTITGTTLLLAGLLIMAILMGAGMNGIGAFFIIFWMLIWGAASLAGGLGKWIASSSEMKLLGIGSQSQLQGAPSLRVLSPGERTDPQGSGYSTGPTELPASVTEQTTRHLDERGYKEFERERDRT